ncbi:MAG: efflux RND transporter periplasmic adaptor subunit [Desulfobacterota bacterium]|jgi:membrane fusion protein (multidrug efflux system)|nr:efflux RND transporter periplasmic adaptor subunit [Thermodesulfobacteriota bacterium]
MACERRYSYEYDRITVSGRRSVVWFMLFFLAGACVTAIGCEKKEETKEEKIFNVKAVPVQKQALRPYIEAVGSLEPHEQVIVSSEVDGILRDIVVDEGTAVTRGAMVARISDIDYRLGVQGADAALGQARSNLENADSVFRRMEALFRQEAVSKQEYDNASTRLDVARQDLQRAKAGLDLARERLSKTTITAPLSGRVKLRMVTAGDFIKAGQPVMVLIVSDPLKLTFSVPEKDMAVLKEKLDVVFTVDPFPRREFAGTLNLIYPSLDERSRMLKAEATVPNRSGELKPGIFARAKVYTSEPRETIVIPITSILYEGTDTRVFIVEKDIARVRRIKLGGKYGEFMEVLEGIQAGEQLIVVGQNTLTDGVSIRVVKQG